jgi:hypothetical protein
MPEIHPKLQNKKPPESAISRDGTTVPEAKDLQTALVQMQDHLMLFGKARELLVEAQSRNDQQLTQWNKLRDEQAKERESLLKDFDGFFKGQTQKYVTLLQEQSREREKLLEAVKESQETAGKLVSDLDSVVTGLKKMVKAVEDAGFPKRLEIIQAIVTTNQATVHGLLTRIDSLEKHNEGQVKALSSEMQKANSALQKELRSTTLATVKSITERLDHLLKQLSDAVRIQGTELKDRQLSIQQELQQALTDAEQRAVQSLLSSQKKSADAIKDLLAQEFAGQSRERRKARILMTVAFGLVLLSNLVTVALLLGGLR